MYIYIKTLVDKIIAATLLPVLLIVLIAICIPQLLTYRVIFFKQRRPGKDEKLFTLLKFQTMRSGNESDDIRTTKFGNILRKLSIDELPQVINILKGDMSFVGPRPLLPEYLPLYNQYHKKRHLVRPGITGLAQVSGIKITNWKEKLDTDVQYVDNLSFSLDMKIILDTLILLVNRAGRSKELIDTKFAGYHD
ncbi:MAG: sugar transferase [Cyclobacteriaceae bacterium]